MSATRKRGSACSRGRGSGGGIRSARASEIWSSLSISSLERLIKEVRNKCAHSCYRFGDEHVFGKVWCLPLILEPIAFVLSR